MVTFSFDSEIGETTSITVVQDGDTLVGEIRKGVLHTPFLVYKHI